MSRIRKRVLLSGLGVGLVLILAAAGWYYKNHHKTTPKKAFKSVQPTTIEDIAKKVASEKSHDSATTTKVTQQYQQKKYDELITTAKTGCPKLTGDDQLTCYSFYGAALEATNKLPELVTLSDEVLKTEAIKHNETARAMWQSNHDAAAKGINPDTVKPSINEEGQ